MADRAHPRRRRVLGRAAALALTITMSTAGWCGAAVAAAPGAGIFIQRMSAHVTTILDAPRPDPDVQLAGLKQVLNDTFDVDFMARAIIGRHRRAMSAAQQQEYRRLFDAITTRALAERLRRYAGVTLAVTHERQIDQRDSDVTTSISPPGGGAPIMVDWRVRQEGDDRRVVDVVAEGVSLILTQRAEVDAIVQQSGVDALLGDMRRRANGDEPVIRRVAHP